MCVMIIQQCTGTIMTIHNMIGLLLLVEQFNIYYYSEVHSIIILSPVGMSAKQLALCPHCILWCVSLSCLQECTIIAFFVEV